MLNMLLLLSLNKKNLLNEIFHLILQNKALRTCEISIFQTTYHSVKTAKSEIVIKNKIYPISCILSGSITVIAEVMFRGGKKRNQKLKKLITTQNTFKTVNVVEYQVPAFIYF